LGRVKEKPIHQPAQSAGTLLAIRTVQGELTLEEPAMTQTTNTTLGDLISMFFNEFMEMYGDEELAAVAAAAVINDLLSGTVEEEEEVIAA
jgi:hypothetical protein